MFLTCPTFYIYCKAQSIIFDLLNLTINEIQVNFYIPFIRRVGLRYNICAYIILKSLMMRRFKSKFYVIFMTETLQPFILN